MADTVPFKPKDDNSETSSSEPTRPERPSSGHGTRTYTSEEVSEIIRVALRDADAGEANTVDHEELMTIARDFGLSDADIDGAFKSIGKTRDDEDLVKRAHLTFKIHALLFVVVQAGLFGINALSMPSYWWVLYPLIGWGMFVAFHGILTRYAPLVSLRFLGDWADMGKELAVNKMSSVETSAAAAFTIPDLYGDLAETSGLARIEGDQLVLEYQTVDSIFGAIKSAIKEVRIPIRDIADVRMERQFWWTRLVIQGHRLKSFERVPGHKRGTVYLAFKREARYAAESLANDLMERVGHANP